MMMRWGKFGMRLGFRRKKTLADRVQDVAEDVVEDVVHAADRAASSARDVYSSAVETVAPLLSMTSKPPTRTARSAMMRSSVLAEQARVASERAAERARDAYGTTVGTVAPILDQAGRVVETALSRTADTTAAQLEAAKEATAAVPAAAAATGAAAAGAVGGFFAAMGAFFGLVLRGTWRLMTLALKTAILVGVAYAGWQWLQSRQQSDRWSAPDYSSPPPPSTSSDGSGASTSGAYRSAV